MRKINCARCRTRRVTKPNRVGTPYLWSSFCELVGEDWNQYSKDDMICNKCHAATANVKLTRIRENRDHLEPVLPEDNQAMARMDGNDDTDGVPLMNAPVMPPPEVPISTPEVPLLMDSDIALYPESQDDDAFYIQDSSMFESQPSFTMDSNIDLYHESQLQMGSDASMDDVQSSNVIDDDEAYGATMEQVIDEFLFQSPQTRMDSSRDSIGQMHGNQWEEHNSNATDSDQSVPPSDSQLSIALSSRSSIMPRASLSSGCIKPTHIIHGIRGFSSSESRCFLCQSKTGRRRVPKTAIKDVWLRKKIYISTGTRCCKEHLSGKEFNQNSMELIEGTQNHIRLTDEELVEWIEAITEEANRTKLPIDFNEDSKMTGDEYEVLTGLNREQFDILLTFCRGDLRNSPCRTARNALAIFLLKMRLNLPQRILAYLFGITHKSRISDILRSVTKSLLKRFVPLFLGFTHISRQDIATHHTSSFARKLYGLSPSSICLVMDATYLRLQKSSNHAEQLKTWSNHKHYNLGKPMVVSTDTSYFLAAEGPYYANNDNNDGKILKSMLLAPSTFASFLVTSHYFSATTTHVLKCACF